MRKRGIVLFLLGIVAMFSAYAISIRLHADAAGSLSYESLIQLTSAELENMDVAEMNLLCAEGLAGAAGLDFPGSMKLLDEWASLVQENEIKYAGQYHQAPQHYDNSYAKYKAVNLGLTLKEDLTCGYNLELVRSGLMNDVGSTEFFKDSKDLFIHGFVTDRSGSCSSLPVLMVAVGRRCGYPLHLVACKGHLFCRWDDGRVRFNVETACPGVDSKPDEYYRTWPHPSSEQEILEEGYLKNLTPAEELGVFCLLRGLCLQENGRYDEAGGAFARALKSFPQSVQLKGYLTDVERRGDR